MVALTRFLGLVDPYALVRISVIPASSMQGRTLLPAVTPVPGRAGTSTTVLAPLVPFDHMRNRRALEVHAEHLLAGVLGGFFDGRRNFVGFAVPDADVSAAIAGDDQRAEAERATALDDFGAAVDADNGGFHAALIGAAIASAAAALGRPPCPPRPRPPPPPRWPPLALTRCRGAASRPGPAVAAAAADGLACAATLADGGGAGILSASCSAIKLLACFRSAKYTTDGLKLQSALPRRIGQGLDSAMISPAAPIEADRVDARRLGLGGDGRAHLFRRRDIAAVLQLRSAHVRRRCWRRRPASGRRSRPRSARKCACRCGTR